MFAAVMTTRQFLSILVSSVLFNNRLSQGQWWAFCLCSCFWQKETPHSFWINSCVYHICRRASTIDQSLQFM